MQGTTTAEEAKRAAAVCAADEIRDGMRIGLGTGSTVQHLLEHIAERQRAGEWRGVIGVPTSRRTEREAQRLGIALGSLAEHRRLDLTIDGADEVDPQFRLIKGMGGALLREKVVASVSDRVVIAVDGTKPVERLGTRSPVPVEVDPFAAPVLEGFLRDLGAEPRLRTEAVGEPVRSDGGNLIWDCRFAGGLADPEQIGEMLDRRPGVLAHGMFFGLADVVVIGHGSRVEVLHNPRPGRR